MIPPLKTNFNGNKIHLMFSKTKKFQMYTKNKKSLFFSKTNNFGKKLKSISSTLSIFVYR